MAKKQNEPKSASRGPTRISGRKAVQPQTIIRGRLTEDDGAPAAGQIVRLVQPGLRAPKVLATARSDGHGRYEFRLDGADDIPANGLSVEVAGRRTGPAASRALPVLAKGHIHNANLTIEPKQSSFERLQGRVNSTLDGTRLSAITDDELERLGELASVARRDLDALRRAETLATDLGVPAPLAFALSRAGDVSDAEHVLAMPPDKQRRLITAAATRGRIPRESAAAIRAALDELQKRAIERAAPLRPSEHQLTFGDASSLAQLDADEQAAIAQLWFRHRSADGFAKAIQRDRNLGAGKRRVLERVFAIGAVTQGDAKLAAALHKDGRIKTPHDVARLQRSDFLKLVEDELALSAGAARERAASLEAAASEAYPQVALLRDIALSPELSADAQTVAGVLLDRDAFELAASAIDDELASHEAAARLPESERLALRAQLKRGQRLLRLTDSYRAAKILESAKINSAHDIVSLGRSEFIKRVGSKDDLGSTAEDMYDRAESAAATSLALFAKFSPALNTVGTVATPVFPTLFDGVPNLETLFGQQTLCACEKCRSVASPAAYFVDLLAFLRNKENNSGGRNALDALTETGARGRPARRPDLLRIELTCKNATTIVPYADLVLEILEQAVAPQTPHAPQTALESDDIAAAAEHINPEAYARLAGAVFPVGLPFSSPEIEARMFLERLGTSRAELMETFAPLFTPPDRADPSFGFATEAQARANIVIAGEWLELTAGERKIICGQPLRGAAMPVQSLWGFTLGTTDWIQRLAKLPEFLDRTGLDYLEALALFNLKSLAAGINPAPALHFADPTNCDPAKIGITGLTAAYLGRLARFLRLWRKLGWTLRDVDRALAALADRDAAGVPLLDEAFLVRLAHVARLRGIRELPIAEILAWWADLDTSDYNADHLPVTRSYFAEIFERDARAAPGGKGPLNLADVMAGSVGNVDDQVSAISAALNISAADCALLIDKLAISGQPVSLATLSLLHRLASLARWLGASFANLLAFRDLAGDPFDSGTPRDTDRTLAFIARWQALSASGVTIEALTYLLTDADTPDRPVAPTALAMEEFLRDLQDGLAATTSGTLPSREDIIAQRVAAHFGLELPAARMLLTALPIAGSKALDALDAVSLIDLTQDPADQAARDRLRNAQDAFRSLHKVSLVTAWLDLRGVAAFDWIIARAPALGWLDLTTLLAPPGAAGLDSWMRLADFAELKGTIPAERHADIFALFALGAVNPGNSTARPERRAYLDALQALTGWRLEDLRSLVGIFNASGGQRLSVLGTQFPYHFRDEQLPVRLLRGMRLLARTGVGTSTLDALIARDPNQNGLDRLAQRAREAAQAAWPRDRWPALAREVRDKLRDQQRTALVMFLLAARGLSEPNALFDHFLVDVEMTSCGKTTRIHAAILSVQLFVQRAQMGLERGVALSAEAMSQWEWMRSYETWATNRKIFLYPENWVTQELRHDKTPFFRELESELMRDDITAESAELAFRHYLEKLDEVSRLQIGGIYVEESTKTRPEVVHVFGRTRNTPSGYYYRQRLGGNRWTAWERVEAEIEGDHLIPIVFEGRLLLFWPIFSEKDSGPFQPEAFLRPLFDLINVIVQVANGIGATVGTMVGAYNTLLDTIAESVKSLSLGAASVDVSDFKLPMDDLPDDPIEAVEAAVEVAAALLQLAIDQHPFKRLLDLLPSKTWDIRLGWSEYRSGQWSSRKISSQSLQFKDKVGPLLAQLCALAREAQTSSGQQESESAFDRRRMFTFDGSVENDTLTIHAHVGFIGIDPLNGDVDGQYRRQLGGFKLLDCRGTLSAFYPQREPFDYLDDLLGELQELAVGSVLTVVDAVEGEPVTPDDDPESTFKREIIPTLLREPRPKDYAIMAPHQYEPLIVPGHPKAYLPADPRLDDFFFLQDARRTFSVSGNRFETAYHPFACRLIEDLNRAGLNSLFDPDVQQLRRDRFREDYDPTPAVVRPLPIEDIDYSRAGAYPQYNWELFFHAPMLIAERLIANQKFADALKWLHTVFDPTDHRTVPAPARFWRLRPFAELASADRQRESLLELAKTIAGARGSNAQRELEALVEDWRENAFDAHRVARLRITAYQKAVVMEYIDALIQWGDQQFRRDDAESVNEATRLYILAHTILGPRPRDIFPLKQPPAKTFSELDLDAFSNALVELEHFHWGGAVAAPGLARPGLAPFGRPRTTSLSSAVATLNRGLKLAPEASGALIHSAWVRLIGARALYFCLPQNPKLLAYWDTVADRLYKIRQCLDIAGVRRDLMPVGAVSDRATFDSDADASIGQGALCYRFVVLAQKATELCADVKALGSAMLAALEKSDAEQLALLRQTHERRLLQAVRDVKVLQVSEAQAALQALQESARSAELRRDYYAERLAAPISTLEAEQLALTGSSVALQAIEAGTMLGAVSLSLLPDFITGFPIAAAVGGGQGASSAAERASRNLGILSALAGSAGSLVGTVATFERRAQEWGLQKALAESDLRQLAMQIEGAQTRIDIAQRDLANHDVQIDQARELDDFLRAKTTSQALYGWMIGQLSAVYFQSYQLAYDMARKAEQAWQFELAQESSSFIGFGYWDSLKQGLLSGEWLQHDLKRMEAAYLDNNHRELEITKHISLQQLDPHALIQLIETGSCTFTLPEVLFDIDFPGHYMRRIKSASLTIPAVIGPYASVNATLRLESSEIRIEDTLAGGSYARQNPDSRFRNGRSATSAVVVSSAQADSGLFETNLRDDRYLPFEGAGALSTWVLELGTAFHPFDYETISDVVVHLRYTARQGRADFRSQVETELDAAVNSVATATGDAGMGRAFSLRHEFPSQWQRFVSSPADGGAPSLTMPITADRFPALFARRGIRIQGADVFIRRSGPGQDLDPAELGASLAPGSIASSDNLGLSVDSRTALLLASRPTGGDLGDWILSLWQVDSSGDPAPLDPSALDDIIVIFRYKLA
ncbi:MAG: neuraminidase-like domain-containing protein [Xanthobacteraceae bacterium]